ncbi:Ig-like domain-containing protein [Candidatus Woesearchaeota archaeon]|nr:Ig-like domain-containing protein [Candidatus Woesearchaeota archaeon]
MVKIQKLSNGQLILTLPKKIAEFKNWDNGTEVLFKEHTKDSLIIQERKDIILTKKDKKGRVFFSTFFTSFIILLLFLIIFRSGDSAAESSKIANFKIEIEDKTGKTIFGDVELYNDQEKVVQELESGTRTKVKKDTYDANISLDDSKQSIKNIAIKGLKVEQKDAIFRIDNPPADIPDQPRIGNWERVYAIDPTAADFEEATLTILAEGSVVYKCKEWDFDSRRCFGEWKKIMDIHPGEEYSLSITQNDPAFGELLEQRPTTLYAYANGGTNPTVTAIVVDAFGHGVPGKTVSFSVNSGSMSQSTSATNEGGIATSTQSGGGLGNGITISADNLSSVTIVTADATTATAANSKLVTWFNEYNQTVYSVHTVSNIIANAANTITFTAEDTNGYPNNLVAFSTDSTYAQSDTEPAYFPLIRRTYGENDRVRTAGTPTGDLDGYVFMRNRETNHLFAFATAGPNPTVTGVVTDNNGTAVQGVNLTFSSSAGSMSIADSLTSYNGTTTSVQSGGSIGDSIVISAPDLNQTVLIYVNNSQAVNANARAIVWFDPVESVIYSATVIKNPSDTYNVLAESTVTTFTAYDRTPYNGATASITSLGIGGLLEQTNISPATSYAAQNAYLSDDWIEIAVATTSGTDGELILARSGSNEFFAFASGGPNPNVTAVVTDADGTGLEGIEVNFSASAGSMSVATGYTGPDGVVTSIQTGGALGNTITVESGALGIRTVFVDDSYDVNAIDRSYGWFDKIRRTVNVATVNRTTNVLANAGTITATALDRTLNNGVLLTTGSATTQNNATPADIIVSPGTYGQGDRLSIGTTTTTPSIDLIINLPAPSNLIWSYCRVHQHCRFYGCF